MDWFTPWPSEALVAVSNYFLSEFPMICSDAVKASVVTTMGTYHDKVSETCESYFERYKTQVTYSSHCCIVIIIIVYTFKIFLNFFIQNFT